MTAYVVHEELVALTPSANQVTVTFPEPIEDGDTLLLMVGGGNQVPSAPSGWTSRDFRTGQEAQGRVMSRVVASDYPAGLDVEIGFDGNDRCGVGLVHVRGECGVDITYAERVGTVGASLGSYGVGFNATGDTLTYLFGFERNSGDGYPTVDDAVQVAGISHPDGPDGTSLYRVQPVEDTATAWTTTAGRSGHYLAGVAVYSIIRTDWLRDSEPVWRSTSNAPTWGYQQVVTPVAEFAGNDNPNEAAMGVYEGRDTIFPTSSPASPNRIELGYNTVAEGWSAIWNSAYQNIDRDTSVWTTGGTGTAPPSVVDPDTGELVAPDAIGIEWNNDPGPALRQRIRARVTTLNTIKSQALTTIPQADRDWLFYAISGTGPTVFMSPDVLSTTGVYVGDVTWQDVHPGGGTADTPYTIYGIIPGNPNAPTELLVTGFHSKAFTKQAPTMSGTADDGVAMVFDAGLQQEYQLEYRLLYRGPVSVGPLPTVPKLRLYPRDDVLGFSGVARQYPPPRRGRLYGQQP